MKHKRMYFIFSILLLIALIITLSTLIIFKSQSKEKMVLLGNPLENTSVEMDYDDTFTSSYMDSLLLEKMIINDASKVINQKTVHVSKLIKKSTHILINIGEKDLSNKIAYEDSSQSFSYNEDLLNKQIEITCELLSNIISKIKDINENILIYVCKIHNPFPLYNESVQSYFDRLNQQYDLLCQKYNFYLI